MALPNMAMIPSGYKPTKLYSVLPTPSYGSEEITNGDFANGSTDWILSGLTVISNGVASFVDNGTNTNSGIQQNSLVSGKQYKITFDVSRYVSGRVQVSIGNNINVDISNGVGTYNIYLESSSTLFLLKRDGGYPNFDFDIDNVSAKEVLVGDADFDVTRATPATRVNQYGLIETPEFILSDELVSNGDFSDGSNDWILESGWSVSGSTANTDGTINKNIKQNNVTTIGKQYKYSFDVLNSSVGDVRGRFRNNNNTVLNFFGDGTYSGYFVATDTSINIVVLSTNTATFSIDNISVVEVERENIPRLDYTDGGCPVLLTEPQSTNLITHSEDFSQWGIVGNVTTTSSYTLSPSGENNATRLQWTNATNYIYQSLSHIGNDFTLSIYLKSNTDVSQNVRLFMDNGAQAKEVVVTTEWQRFEVTNTTTPTQSNRNVGLIKSNNQVGDLDISIWGAQFENLPYSTSIIPTNGSAVTRNQDIVNNAGTSATYNSVEGVLFAEIAALREVNDNVQFMGLGSGTYTDNSVMIQLRGAANQIGVWVYSNSVNQVADSLSVSDITSNTKIALKWKQNDFAVWIGGVEVFTDVTFDVPTVDSLNTLSFSRDGSQNFFGKTSQVQVFNTALSNFDLQNLTSYATGYATYETMRTSLNFNIQ